MIKNPQDTLKSIDAHPQKVQGFVKKGLEVKPCPVETPDSAHDQNDDQAVPDRNLVR